MADNANSPKLQSLFLHHRIETECQIKRLDHIFRDLEINIQESKIKGIPKLADQKRELIKTLVNFNFTDASKGMDGILQEGAELLRHFGQTDISDLALINIGQKIEHFEIASYQFARLLVQRYSQTSLFSLFDESIKEESLMAEKLMALAKSIFLHK